MKSFTTKLANMSKALGFLILLGLVSACDIFTPVPVTSVAIAESSDKLSAGSTLTLTAVVSPDDATNTGVTWSSSNAAVATVDATGIVTPIGFGTVTITATSAADPTLTGTRTLRVGYTETFTNPGNWSQADTSDCKFTTTNGEYVMEAFNDNLMFRSFARMPFSFNESINVALSAPYTIAVDLSIDAANDSINEISAAGVIFNNVNIGETNYRYDMVQISANGKFAVARYDSSTASWTTYQDYTPSAAIKTDGTANAVFITQNASTFSINVNGVVLGNYTNASVPSGAGLIGFFITEVSADSVDPISASAAFDNLEAYPAIP